MAYACTGLKYPERSPGISQRILESPQFNNGKFECPVKALTMTPKDMLKTAFRYFRKDNNQEPSVLPPIRQVDLSLFKKAGRQVLNSTWLGHSTLLINISGCRIITDPVFETKISIVGPRRYNGDIPLDPQTLPDIDVVIISHDHYDHLNKASVKLLVPKTKIFLAPLGVGKRLVRWGVPGKKIHELDWWESFIFKEYLRITATPAQHFSGRGLFDRNKTLWASWVICNDAFNIFFSGDSGYFNGFKTIGEKFGPFDLAFLECGAYDKLWHGVHMYPEETVQAHQDLKGKLLHPIHWGTFNLAHHPWYDPMVRVKNAADKNHIKLVTPVTGQSIDDSSGRYGESWWTEFTRIKEI